MRRAVQCSLIIVVLSTTLQAFSPVVLRCSEARDLTEVFVQGFSYEVVGKNTAPAAAEFAPTLSAAVAQAVTQEFPHASVAPAFTYHFNPTFDAVERSTGVPGPLFSERALNLGAGRLNFSVGYAFIDFSELNGTDL